MIRKNVIKKKKPFRFWWGNFQQDVYFMWLIAQLAGAVEYIDCISVEGEDTPQKRVLDMILNNLMVRFQ